MNATRDYFRAHFTILSLAADEKLVSVPYKKIMSKLSSSLGRMIPAVVLGLVVCNPGFEAANADEADGKAEDPRLLEYAEIAEEGFVYGLPLVMCYTAAYEFWVDKNSGQYKSPMNELFNERRVFTYKDTSVVTPNSDTPYSFACLDLRAEPFVVSVPDVEPSRYYSVQLVDWNTFNFGYIGSRATGNKAGDYLVVGPGWQGETPQGIEGVFRSSSDFTIALFRTQLFNADDLPNVIKVQDGYNIQPLSSFLKTAAPAAAPVLSFPPASAELAKTNFFEFLGLLVKRSG